MNKACTLIVLFTLIMSTHKSSAQSFELDVKCTKANTNQVYWTYKNDTATIQVLTSSLNLTFIQPSYSIELIKGKMLWEDASFVGSTTYDKTIIPKNKYLYTNNYPDAIRSKIRHSLYPITRLPFTSPFLIQSKNNKDTVALYNYKYGIKHGYCSDLKHVNEYFASVDSKILHYKNGKLDGTSIYYLQDSGLLFKEYNKGIWLNSKTYNKYGTLIQHEIDGILNRHYYPSGKLKSSIDSMHFKDKSRLDYYYTIKKYYPNGAIAMKGQSYNLKISMEFGVWYWYDSTGRITKEKDYNYMTFAPKKVKERMKKVYIERAFSLPNIAKKEELIIEDLKKRIKWRKRHQGTMTFKVTMDYTGKLQKITNIACSKKLRKKAIHVEEYLSSLHYRTGQFGDKARSNGSLLINLTIKN